MGVGKKTKERKYMLEVVIKDRNITENYRWVYLKGSIIYNACWEGYKGVSELVYTHKTINHSLELVNSITRVYANTIRESLTEAKVNTLARNRS